MAEPTTVLAAVEGTLKVVATLATYAIKFTRRSRAHVQRINDLKTQIESLDTILKQSRSCLELLPAQPALDDTAGKRQELLTGLKLNVEHCNTSLEKLHGVFKDLEPKEGDKFWRHGINATKLELRSSELDEARLGLQAHNKVISLGIGLINTYQLAYAGDRHAADLADVKSSLSEIIVLVRACLDTRRQLEATQTRNNTSTPESRKVMEDQDAMIALSQSVKEDVETRMRNSDSVSDTPSQPASKSRGTGAWVEAGFLSIDRSMSDANLLMRAHSGSSKRRAQERSRSDPSVTMPWDDRDMSLSEDITLESLTEAARAHRRGTRKRLKDQDYDHISHLLRQSGKHNWAHCPRTYLVLSLIDQLKHMDDFVRHKITDVSFPYTCDRVPHFIEDEETRSNFVDWQSCVMHSSSTDPAKDGRHRYLNGERGNKATFIVLRNLGKGGQGLVDVVRHRKVYQEYARKRIARSQIFADDKRALGVIENEIHHLKRLDHHHLVNFIGSYTDVHYIAILMEPVADCDLSHYLEETVKQSFDARRLDNIRSFFGCLISAVVYLHRAKCRHKDIKPANILVKNDVILLTDFGIALDSSHLATDATSSVHPSYTGAYAAPELFKQSGVRSSPSDIFALGCVFLDMMTILKKQDLAARDLAAERQGVNFRRFGHSARSLGSWIVHLETFSQESDTPLIWVRDMVQQDPMKRPTASALLHTVLETGGYCGPCCDHGIIDSSEDVSRDETASEDEDSGQELEHTQTTTQRSGSMTELTVPNSKPSDETVPLKFVTAKASNTQQASDSAAKSALLLSVGNALGHQPIVEEVSPGTSQIDVSAQHNTRSTQASGNDVSSDSSTDDETPLGLARLELKSSRSQTQDITKPVIKLPNLGADERPLPPLAQEIAEIVRHKDYRALESFLADRSSGMLEAVRSIDDSVRNSFGETILHYCASFDDKELGRSVVTSIKPSKRLMNAIDFAGNTALHRAAAKSDTAFVKILRRFKADLAQPNLRKQTPLHLAVRFSNINVVKLLVRTLSSNPEDINCQDDLGSTPLHYAVQRTCFVQIRLLLEADADARKCDLLGNNALMLCRPELGDVLKEVLIDTQPDSLDQTMEEVLRAKPERYNCEISQLLKTFESRFVSGVPVVPCACSECITKLSARTLGDMRMLKRNAFFCPCDRCEAYKSDFLGTNEDSKILQQAQKCDNRDGMTRYDLLADEWMEQHSPCNCKECRFEYERRARDQLRKWNLMSDSDHLRLRELNRAWASLINTCEDTTVSQLTISFVATLLLDNGANIDAVEPRSGLALVENALLNGMTPVVRCLRSLKSRLLFPVKPTVNALSYAVHSGDRLAVRVWSKHNEHLSMDQLHVTGKATALHYVIQHWDARSYLLPILLNPKVDLDTQNADGLTPLHLAIHEGHESAIEQLLAAGASVNATSTMAKVYPLTAAINMDEVDIVEMLVQRGAAVENPGSAIHTAARRKSVHVLLRLLDIRAKLMANATSDTGTADVPGIQALLDVDVQDEAGRTTLQHLSVLKTSDAIKCLPRLLECGVDVNEQASDGTTALHQAARAGVAYTIHLLKEHGAVTDLEDGDGKTAADYARAGGYREIVELLGEQYDEDTSTTRGSPGNASSRPRPEYYQLTPSEREYRQRVLQRYALEERQAKRSFFGKLARKWKS